MNSRSLRSDRSAQIFAVRQSPQRPVFDKVVEHDLTGLRSEPKQQRGLLDAQTQAGHFAIRSDNHGHEALAVWFITADAARLITTIEYLKSHHG